MNPIAIYFLILFISSIYIHYSKKLASNVSKRSLIISLVFTIIFQILAFIEMGHLDPFVLIAVVIQFILSFILTICVGLLIEKLVKN
jgi:hypothetical protein